MSAPADRDWRNNWRGPREPDAGSGEYEPATSGSPGAPAEDWQYTEEPAEDKEVAINIRLPKLDMQYGELHAYKKFYREVQERYGN